MKRPRSDGPAAFEPVAARIRARAERILADLPVEDPNVVWARRAALLAEIDGTEAPGITIPLALGRGTWKWAPE
jgi:hypothetical protein